MESENMMDSSKFQQWLLSNRIEERSLEQAWQSIDRDQNKIADILLEKKIEFNKKFLLMKVEGVDLWLGNWPECDERYILVEIPLMYKKIDYIKKGRKCPLKDGKEHLIHIGTYKLQFGFNGEIKDGEFEWYL